MGLPHFTLDLRPEFRAGVVEPFLAGYAAGETPNPCIRCNGHVRLDAMLEFADALGARYLATGHYARVTDDGLLRAAADPAKDQAYMLAALSPASLARMRFPLAELTKPEVRALAAEAGLPVATRADSQDLCFLAGVGKARFLARHGGLEDAPGEIVRRSGEVVGRAPRRAPLHGRAAQGARRGRAPSRCTCCAPTGVAVVVGTRDELARRSRARARRAAAPAGRGGRRRAAALPLARRAVPGRGGGAVARAGAAASRSMAPRPGRWRACCGATWSWAGGPSPPERRRTAALRGRVRPRGDSITRSRGCGTA